MLININATKSNHQSNRIFNMPTCVVSMGCHTLPHNGWMSVTSKRYKSIHHCPLSVRRRKKCIFFLGPTRIKRAINLWIKNKMLEKKKIPSNCFTENMYKWPDNLSLMSVNNLIKRAHHIWGHTKNNDSSICVWMCRSLNIHYTFILVLDFKISFNRI